MELDSSRPDVFLDLICEIFAHAGNIPQRSGQCERFDIVRQSFDVHRRPAVGAYAERVRSLDFKQICNLIKDERDFEIPHWYVYFTSF